MIDLQKFISETLVQIINGVTDAQEKAKQKGAYVNTSEKSDAASYTWATTPTPRLIEFDIAVTTTESQNSQSGVGIFVAAVGLGGQTNEENAGSQISRIKFSIPVILPEQKES